MPKRKREDLPEPDPPRRSERKRKRVSFGEEFVEQWSPPRGSAATASGLSEDPLDPTENEPGTSEQTITWPSEPRYYSQELPPNHRKCLHFIHKRLDLDHQRSSSALYLMYLVYARNELVSFVSGNLQIVSGKWYLVSGYIYIVNVVVIGVSVR